MLKWIAALAGIWAGGWTLLSWPRLSASWRRRLAVATSAAGLVALVLAVNTEGLRESPTVTVFLLGTSYVTEKASASASLPYYVLTGVLLLLGFTGLALGDDIAAWLRGHWLLASIGLSLGVTALRFLLEKVAAPSSWTQAVGVTWLAPVVGAHFALILRSEGRGLHALVVSLLAYAFAVRGSVAALMVAATTFRLGSHYDLSSLTRVRDPFGPRVFGFEPGSLHQLAWMAAAPQLIAWPIFTLLAGLLGAAVVHLAVTALGRPGLPWGAPAPVSQD